MAEKRTYNPERYGTDIEGPCWCCGSPILYFVDEDGTPRDITPDTREIATLRAALDGLVEATLDYEESVESPLAARYSRSVARAALRAALATAKEAGGE
jgi:hypothetical protein